jgi:hypothetical protein
MGRRGFGARRPCSERDRLAGPSGQGGARQRARLAVLRGAREPLQGRRPRAPPSAAARSRRRVRLGGLPEVPSSPRRLRASMLGPPRDGSGARRQRVAPPIAQARDLAPRAWRNRLDDAPGQGPHPPMPGSPVEPVPAHRGPARGRLSGETPPGTQRRGCRVAAAGSSGHTRGKWAACRRRALHPDPSHDRSALASARVPYRRCHPPCWRVGDAEDFRLARPRRASPADHVSPGAQTGVGCRGTPGETTRAPVSR